MTQNANSLAHKTKDHSYLNVILVLSWVIRQQLLEMVRANGLRPEGTERRARELYLREASLRSPNGQWIAIKSEYVYGAQDVLLIKAQ